METVLLEKIMAGDDKGESYEETLRTDRFFTEQIVTAASSTMRSSVVKSLGHAVVLLGPENIRNMVYGHTIERIHNPQADMQFAGIQESAKFCGLALRAEDHARRCGNEYTALAFAGGYLFELFRAWAQRDPSLGENVVATIDSIYKHSLRTAAISWAITSHPKILIAHRRPAYVAGLLHDVGKAALACTEPQTYLKCFEEMKEAQKKDPSDDIYDIEIEKRQLKLSHPEVGSFVVFGTKYLREIESLIDFHHDFVLLKKRDQNLFLLACVINIADRIAFLLETNSQLTESDLTPILKPHKSYFPLHTGDILNIVMSTKNKALL